MSDTVDTKTTLPYPLIRAAILVTLGGWTLLCIETLLQYHVQAWAIVWNPPLLIMQEIGLFVILIGGALLLDFLVILQVLPMVREVFDDE